MEEKKEIKGLYPKIHQIQKVVNGLKKDKSSGVGNSSYKYVTGEKVLDHIKPLMNELGLLLKPEILDIENTRIDYQVSLVKDSSGAWTGKPKSEILTKVKMRMTWIDVETGEKDENLWGANGQNDWEKGLGSALTYAERYFLLKYFHIATDEDDVDNGDRKPKDESMVQQPQQEKKPFNKEAAIKAIMEVVGDNIDKLQSQMDYHKIDSLDKATEVQLKTIYKFLKGGYKK